MFRDNDDIPEDRRTYCRMIIAFFFLGTCKYLNLMALTMAAKYIINVNVKSGDTRNQILNICGDLTTSIFVLSWVIPATLISLIIPFLPILVNVKIFLGILLAVLGYLLSALAGESLIKAVVGAMLVSISDVITEVTLLQYTNYFHITVVPAFASGTGVAGLIGVLSYTLGIHTGNRFSIFYLIPIPIIMGCFFWLLLPNPNKIDSEAVDIQQDFNASEIETPFEILGRKFYLIPKVLYKYISPLGWMFLFEYFINQGTYQMQKPVIDHFPLDEFPWFQVSYQVGVFISRSSGNFIYISKIWILTCLQIINVLIFTTSAIYSYIRYFWILEILAFEEGLIGGAAYVNTFVKIRMEEEEEDKQFITSFTCFGNNAGVMIASFAVMIMHASGCKLSD